MRADGDWYSWMARVSLLDGPSIIPPSSNGMLYVVTRLCYLDDHDIIDPLTMTLRHVVL
jgi:hypothetical protein